MPRTWAWNIATVFGIVVSVHATFVLLVVWVAGAYWFETQNLARVASGIALLLLLFACVLLHELGHALTARRFGFITREITLLPIGGIARLERLPDDPRQSLLITLAGPAVNIAIAMALFILLQLSGQWEPLTPTSLLDAPLLQRLMLVNISLVVFNMLPAFPMDGGRALRAILATRMNDQRATRIAARIGQGMAVLFAFVGWLGNPLLILIALFVWAGAAAEARTADIRAAVRGVPIERVMLTAFTTLNPDEPLATAVELMQHEGRHEFPVTRDGHLVGLLTRPRLLHAIEKGRPQARVADAMDDAVHAVDPGDMLDTALPLFDAGRSSIVPVVRDGRLIGLLTAEAIAEFLAIQAARARAGA